MQDSTDLCFCLEHLMEVLNIPEECTDNNSLCWYFDKYNKIVRTSLSCTSVECCLLNKTFIDVVHGKVACHNSDVYMLLVQEHNSGYEHAIANGLDEILLTCIPVPEKSKEKSNTFVSNNSVVVLTGDSVSKFYFKGIEANYTVVNREIVISSFLNGIPNLRKYLEFPSVLFEYDAKTIANLEKGTENKNGGINSTAGIMFALADRVPRFSTPDSDVMKTLNSLVGCLSFIHSCGIAHGDIKVGNHCYNKNGDVVLIDIGNCNLLVETINLYTPGYEAPELLTNDKKHIDPSCDVYALGVVILEFISGVSYDYDTDPYLSKGNVSEDNQDWLEIAVLCLSDDLDMRPKDAMEIMSLLGLDPVRSDLAFPRVDSIVIKEEDVVNPALSTLRGNTRNCVKIADILYSTLYEGMKVKQKTAVYLDCMLYVITLFGVDFIDIIYKSMCKNKSWNPDNNKLMKIAHKLMDRKMAKKLAIKMSTSI